jgi:predicted metal-binding protein
MLQVWDGSRQYKQKAGYVLVGQTLDDTLSDVLRHRHSYVESAGGIWDS